MGEKSFAAGLIDNSRSVSHRVTSVPIPRVKICSGFWRDRIEATRDNGMPRLLELLEEHGVLDNFRRISWGKSVDRRGPVFTDSDLYKWFEGASLFLQSQRDKGLESLLGGIIEDIAGAQQEDGYINTFFVGDRARERFVDLEKNHEFYCIGHLIQAAVAHYRATGDQSLLTCAAKAADLLIETFGPGKRRGCSGHPELEMAMVELYRTLGDRRYLSFTGYLLDQIGFTKRRRMEGHAVRAGYACCGATDYYMETGDKPTKRALQRLWTDMAERKVYITGGIGSRYVGEAFGEPYELPNQRAYAETCAAVSNLMWSWRMLMATGEAKYADMMERVLYNGFLSGVSVSGDKYFYTNPLESSGADGGHPSERKEWYATTCCPTNVIRTMASLPGYIYGAADGEIWINLYQASALRHRVKSTKVTIRQETMYPWNGDVTVVVEPARAVRFKLLLRIPSWTPRCGIEVKGDDEVWGLPGSFFELDRLWTAGDEVLLHMEMPVTAVESHPRVREDFGCAAITRGPLVYCVESTDNPGFNVLDLLLPSSPRFSFEFRPNLLGGVGTIGFDAYTTSQDGPIYQPLGRRKYDMRAVHAVAIPYYAWANRGASSMLIWIPRATSVGSAAP